MKEYAIGEVFEKEVNGEMLTLRCVKDKEGADFCSGCKLDTDGGNCLNYETWCGGNNRKDGEDVHFEEVK